MSRVTLLARGSRADASCRAYSPLPRTATSFAAVEKGVAGGAVAHAVALQGLQAGDGGRGTGSAGGQDDGVSRVIPRQGLHRQLVGKGQAHGLRLHELHPHGFGALDAPALQLGPRDGAGHAVVVLDAPRPGPVRRAHGSGRWCRCRPAPYTGRRTPPPAPNQ